MLNKRSIVVSLLVLMLALSACAGTAQTPAVQPGGADPNATMPAGEMVIDANTPAVAAAIASVSEMTGISADQISFVSAEAVQWSDSCLGLGGPAESCLQAITSGFNVLLSAAGTNYEVHTNEDGTAVRIKPE